MTKVRVAIIGLGMAVAPHARSLLDLAEQVEVVAAYSPTEARRAEFVRAYGFRVTADIDGIFADRTIDAVMILTPPSTHLDLVRRAASVGKHILLEKPLEVSLERSEALVAAADDAGVVFGLVLQNRFRPSSRALAKVISEGRLGLLVSASARLRNWRPQSYYDVPGRGTKARDGGGVLLTQAIHSLDLLIWFAGLPDGVRAYATTSSVHRMETEDLVTAALQFPNGVLGVIFATTSAYPGFPEQIELIGEHGTAILEGERLQCRVAEGEDICIGGASDDLGAAAGPMAFSHHHHRALISNFIAAIRGEQAMAITGTDGLRAHRLIEAILTSAAQPDGSLSMRR